MKAIDIGMKYGVIGREIRELLTALASRVRRSITGTARCSIMQSGFSLAARRTEMRQNLR